MIFAQMPAITAQMPAITAQMAAITIRPADAADQAKLRRLAALDSSELPQGHLIVAEVEGELRVAMSMEDRAAIADPFYRTAELVALMREHVDRAPAGSSRPRRGRPARLLRSLRPRTV